MSYLLLIIIVSFTLSSLATSNWSSITVHSVELLKNTFEQNCTSYNILSNRINSCNKNNIYCKLFVYTNELNECLTSLFEESTACIYLKQCVIPCKKSTNGVFITNCYKDCFVNAYGCSSLPKENTNNYIANYLIQFGLLVLSIIIFTSNALQPVHSRRSSGRSPNVPVLQEYLLNGNLRLIVPSTMDMESRARIVENINHINGLYNFPSQSTANWYSPPYSYELPSVARRNITEIQRAPYSHSPDVQLRSGELKSSPQYIVHKTDKKCADSIDCAICFNTLTNESYVYLGCSHEFCKNCIKECLHIKDLSKCPLCRAPITNVYTQNPKVLYSI